MMTLTELAFVPSDTAAPFTDRLRLAVAAYLARFKGSSREHTESAPRCYLAWCAERGLDPLAARRPHLRRLLWRPGPALYGRMGGKALISAGVSAAHPSVNNATAQIWHSYGGDTVALWAWDNGDLPIWMTL